VSLHAVPTVRAVWLVLTGMMLVSRVLFQAAGAARMRSFLDVWKVGRVRQCWGAVSLALAATVVVLLVRDRRDLDAIDWMLALLLVAILVADGSVNVLPSGFTTFKDRVQSAWVKRNRDARAGDSRMFGVVNLGLAIAAATMFAFAVLYRSASVELVAGATAAAVIVTPLLVGLALAEGRRSRKVGA
jgi:hypothetical protein